MWEVFNGRPEQIVGAVAVISGCLIVLGSVAIKAWRQNEAHKREAELKMEMVARGMSADEITRVLAAESPAMKLAAGGCGKRS